MCIYIRSHIRHRLQKYGLLWIKVQTVYLKKMFLEEKQHTSEKS